VSVHGALASCVIVFVAVIFMAMRAAVLLCRAAEKADAMDEQFAIGTVAAQEKKEARATTLAGVIVGSV